MAKERFLIEHDVPGSNVFGDIHLSTVNESGDSRGGCGNFQSVEDAKAKAQEMATDDGEPVTLVWKDPPQAWQPDAICVSQYLTPMYPDLPT